MKKTWVILFSAALLSSDSFAASDCITVSRAVYLFPGHIEEASLAFLPSKASIAEPIGTIEPISYMNHIKTAGGWSPILSIKPGHGIIVNAPAGSICFSNGLTPILPLPLPAGYSLVCCQTNAPATFEAIVGRPPDPGTKVFRLQPGGVPAGFDDTNYLVYTFADGAWLPEAPVAGIGEAVWVFQPPTMSNVKIVAGQFGFDALTPLDATATVEYTGALEDTDSWLVLTNVAGFGGTTNITDPADANVVTQRFFRLNLHK